MAGRALLVMLMPLGPQDEDAEGPALMLPLHSFLTSPCFLSTLGLSGYSSLDMATERLISACPLGEDCDPPVVNIARLSKHFNPRGSSKSNKGRQVYVKDSTLSKGTYKTKS